MIKVSDYIVDYLIKKGIKHVFGYPGGMVTHLMDSFKKKESLIVSHLLYHEQALSFAGCAYAQLTMKPTVVYATSGPGATNLVTGIANAYFDSIPIVFITGQVNTSEINNLGLRQRGFQETDIVSMVKGITKSAIRIDNENDIKRCLDEAFFLSQEGRPGPVLIDLPMNVSRALVEENKLIGFAPLMENKKNTDYTPIQDLIKISKRPVLLLGAGLKFFDRNLIKEIVKKTGIPVVTSMIACDLGNYVGSFGFIGAYGSRTANFIVAKSDLIISIGSRLDIRQVGGKRSAFAPNARIIRIDIDSKELEYLIREDDLVFNTSCDSFLKVFIKMSFPNYKDWYDVCNLIKDKLEDIDKSIIQKRLFDSLNAIIPPNSIVTTDVGQNQVWAAQYLNSNSNVILFSGGHASMGYSLPASIGASYARQDSPIISINGDGGIQMNIQELQTIARDKLPIKIIVLNNSSLGMIRHFQEMYFNSVFAYTTNEDSFINPSFVNVAKAYGIHSVLIEDLEELKSLDLSTNTPLLIEIRIKEPTYVVPKLEFGKPNQDQEPLIDRVLFEELMAL